MTGGFGSPLYWGVSSETQSQGCKYWYTYSIVWWLGPLVLMTLLFWLGYATCQVQV